MTVVYELAIRAAKEDDDAVRGWFDAGPGTTWRKLPQLEFLDLYLPAEQSATDPYVNDGRGPCLLCMLGFADEAALKNSISHATFKLGLGKHPPGAAITTAAMIRKFYSIDGETDEHMLQAPFSYVVRYHRPAEDERAFVQHYVADHPALLARLPKIRSVLCYFPIPPHDPHGLASADYMLGNEVVFDSIDDFNAAMASPIRHELRAHFRNFPPFSGRNTHYPMVRTQVVSR